jgi:8-oxo-dGTP pyrophosphatase MutT (NUDIX family)
MSPYFQRLRARVGHELLLIAGVAAVIHDETGRLLLQETSSGEGWSLPAGAIEPGESPRDAVIREVREETGLVVEPRKILDVFGGPGFRHTYANGDVVEYTVVLYLCTVVERGAGQLDPETKSLRYFAQSEMPPLALAYPLDTLFTR